jgi:hypothetical protein
MSAFWPLIAAENPVTRLSLIGSFNMMGMALVLGSMVLSFTHGFGTKRQRRSGSRSEQDPVRADRFFDHAFVPCPRDEYRRRASLRLNATTASRERSKNGDNGKKL